MVTPPATIEPTGPNPEPVTSTTGRIPQSLLRLRDFLGFFLPKETYQWLFVVAVCLFVFGIYRGLANNFLLGGMIYSGAPSIHTDVAPGVAMLEGAEHSVDSSAPAYFAVVLLLIAGILRADFKFEERKRQRMAEVSREEHAQALLRILEEGLGRRRKVQAYIFALIVPVWLTLIYVAMNLSLLTSFLRNFVVTAARLEKDDPSVGVAVLSIVVVILTVTVVCILYFMVKVPIRDLMHDIKKTSDDIEFEQTRTDEGRHNYLRRKLQHLTTRSAQVFSDGASSERQLQAAQWCARATQLLEAENDHSIVSLNDAQFLLTSVEELILREESELVGQRNWQFVAIGIVVIHFVGLLGAIIFYDAERHGEIVPLLGIPYVVIFWGALGGLAAVLYRFYTETTRVRFEAELRWLIARPLIGIIMGTITYLALATGLVLFGNSTESDTSNQIYWLVAFVAGFSDRFYLAMIELVVGKFVIEDEQVQEVKVKQTTSVVNKRSELADA